MAVGSRRPSGAEAERRLDDCNGEPHADLFGYSERPPACAFQRRNDTFGIALPRRFFGRSDRPIAASSSASPARSSRIAVRSVGQKLVACSTGCRDASRYPARLLPIRYLTQISVTENGEKLVRPAEFKPATPGSRRS
jgi:hypothetical protein